MFTLVKIVSKILMSVARYDLCAVLHAVGLRIISFCSVYLLVYLFIY